MAQRRTAVKAPLTRDRVLAVAVELADEKGVSALTMRALAERLGVEAMSLYHHVRNKDDILDGMVDAVFAEIDTPAESFDWRTAMRQRAVSLRAVLIRHPWAIALMDSRADPGPATLRHHEWMLATLRTAGFSLRMAAHAFSVLDSYIYGFVQQEANLPFADAAGLEEVAAGIVPNLPAGEFPYMTEMITELVLRPGYSYGAEFDYGLDLILDGLERVYRAE
ncbi:TetR/AcrR family transcriptional regulator C-terminal domain-containing protein [Nocardia transvalensis]|uniref:TetR/AcrR family transcriptional regulator C-terminal domain-containing protein n=1 Tax=Nocardia transvalensis TaxID=37333 RepID=UPI0018957907|nr:TetR/AcrR family transcriptional regulator C-terminal domain-containing protein [Nocardia transvalensis]MBF6327558.1 TetR/AcrR family transcriptional regulator C-terminal domain-containing protein [Nocardia transvalensis]